MRPDDIEFYFNFLDHDHYDLRAFTPDETALDEQIAELQRVSSLGEFKAFCQRLNGKANIYAAILPKTSDGKSKEHVRQVDKVWIELDAERADDGAAPSQTVEDAKRTMTTIVEETKERFGQPLVVMSGNGYHLIWEIPAVDVHDDNREKLNDKLNAFCHHFKEQYETPHVEVDTAVGELARILKIPGTKSVKGNPEHWRTSRIVAKPEQTAEQRQQLRDFFLMLDPPQSAANQAEDHIEHYDGSVTDDKLQWVRENDDLFDRLYSGKATKNYPSRSEAELALANKAAFYQFDIDTILSQANIGKWNEASPSYRENTRQKAIASTTEHIDWDDIDAIGSTDPVSDDNPDDDDGGDTDNNTSAAGWQHVIEAFKKDRGKPEKTKRIANHLLKHHHFKTPRDTKRTWHFKNPVYEPDGEQTIEEILWDHLNGHISQHQVNEVKDAIRSRTYVDRQEQKAPAKYIPVENGWYNLKTGELEDPDPSYFVVNHVPVTYDPDADCPNFKQFVHDIVRDEDVPLIQEMFGYCLYREYPLARAFMLLGNGGNGKSTLLKVLEHFIGQNNVANPSLQKLGEDRFASAQLYGKLANIHADLSSKTLQNTGTFKMLTGGDLIHAERKFEDPFQFKNYAKLIYSANELPRTHDTTKAFFRRWIVIKFPYTFTDDPNDGNKDKDPNIEQDLLTDEEMSGLFNWAIEGLKRILDEDRFSKGQTREEVKYEWLLQSQPMTVFFEAGLEKNPQKQVSKDHLYEQYCVFCEMVGAESKDKSQFFKALYSEVPSAREKRVRVEHGRKWVVAGVEVRDLEEVVRVVSEGGNRSSKENGEKSDLSHRGQGGKGENPTKARTGAGAHARMNAGVTNTPDHPDQDGESPPSRTEGGGGSDSRAGEYNCTRDGVLDAIDRHDDGDGAVIEDVVEAVRGVEEDVLDRIERLQDDGEVFEPRPGRVKKL